VEAHFSTQAPPGGHACDGGRADTLGDVVIANLTRRFFLPGRPAAGDGAGGCAPAVERDVRSPGLLAELREGPVISRPDVPPAVNLIRIVVLVMVLVTVPLFTPHFAQRGVGLATAVALAASAAAWVVWQFAERRPRLWLISLAVLGAAGGALAGLSPASTAVAVGFVVVVSAGARLSTEVSFAIAAETVAAFLIAALAAGAPATALIGWTLGLVGLWAFGLTRRAYVLRAVEAEDALEQAHRAHAAETQAAALAERARIAREIHDVLAHSLAAVSVNLQAAEGLLDALADKGPEVAKAIECVERAGALTKEGMTETRRAILALRDDAADNDAGPGYAAGPAASPAGTGPADGSGARAAAADRAGQGAGESSGRPERLAGRLRALADEHSADGDGTVEFTVTGTPHPLGPEAALTAFRTAQEALTNARKHAPGQPVGLTVRYAPDETVLTVSNALPPGGTEGPLARAGAGYGLTGLRERAALAGGTLAAGPDDGQWLVRLRLPA
jgi:signal transduction histidine kinase